MSSQVSMSMPEEQEGKELCGEQEENLDRTVESQTASTPKVIPFNPSATEVHRRERGAPWRTGADKQLRESNEKALKEQQERRRWGLAKQIQEGLMHNYNINYGVAELATLLRDGIRLRETEGESYTPIQMAQMELLQASEKYDLKRILSLLDHFPKDRRASCIK